MEESRPHGAWEGAKHITSTLADGTMQTPVLQRAPHCHREQHRPLRGPTAPVGLPTGAYWGPMAGADTTGGCPLCCRSSAWLPACLQRGHAARTADHSASTVLGGLGRASVPFLNSKAGSLPSSLDAPNSLSPAAHTSHSCTVLPHRQPRLCPTQWRRAQSIGFDPGHRTCTAAAAQPAPHRHNRTGTPEPNSSGDNAAVAGTREAPGRGLAARPRRTNSTT